MTSTSSSVCPLSERDAAVLQFLFNPLVQSLDQAYSLVDKELRSEEKDTEGLDGALLQQVKELETKGVQEARQGNLTEALTLLTQAIELVSSYSSPYNNRAQVHRLLRDYEASKKDLDQAILLSDPSGQGKNPLNPRVAKLAYAQRGFLLKGFLEREEEGQKDLVRAADLGHNLAALETNPFRALCGEMVSVMMREQCGVNM